MEHSSTTTCILRGATRSADPIGAAREFHAQVAQEHAALVVFFCSPFYELDELGAELSRLFGDTPLVGCTTGGEIGPHGYRHGTLTGASFSAAHFKASMISFDGLSSFEMSDGADAATRLLRDLRAQGADVNPLSTFAFLLVDAIPAREEIVTSALHLNLQGVSMFGGSAADEYQLDKTWLFSDGAFKADRFVMVAMHTELPFVVFRHQHFEPYGPRHVVTDADPMRRLVREINGRPAAEEYARILGRELVPGNPSQFGTAPLMIQVAGEYYLRSVMETRSDGVLRFACAIEEGLVFQAGRSLGLAESLEAQMDTLRQQVGPPEMILAADCIARAWEMEVLGETNRIGAILAQNHAVGFASYGEQINSMHVNQTLTGVAIGSPKESA